MRVPWILVALVLAGCASAPDAPLEAATVAPDAPTSPAAGPVVVVEAGGASLGAVELDVLCRAGGGLELARVDGARIGPAVKALRATLAMQSGTGHQLGYAVDGGDILWTPVAGPGEETFEIPVEPDQAETAQPRWSFWHQGNVPPPAQQDCYTGIILNGWSVRVETVPG